MESKRTMSSGLSGSSHSNLNIDERFGQKVFDKMRDFFQIESSKLDEILDTIQHICQELESFDNSIRELAKETLYNYNNFDKNNKNNKNKNKNRHTNKNKNKNKNEKNKTEIKKAIVDEKYLRDNPIFDYNISNIVRQRQGLISNYIGLEQLNMKLQIQQIMSEDFVLNSKDSKLISNSINSNGFNGKTSNSAELVFYVLKKIAQRSFETYDINAACAIINHIYNCLDIDYKEWLDLLLRKEPGQGDESYAEQFYKSARNLGNLYNTMNMNINMNINTTAAAAAAAEMLSTDKSRKTVIILNNLDQSIRNVKRLKCELEEEMSSDTFSGVSEKEKFQLRNCLDMFNESEKSFERIVDRGIFRFSQSYHDLFKQTFEKFQQLNYDMNEKDFSQSNYSGNSSNSNINKNSSNSSLVGNAQTSGVGGGGITRGGGTQGGGINRSQSGGSGHTSHGSFLGYLRDTLRPHLKALSMRLERDNFHRITTNLLGYMLNEMERMLLNHKFTFWGAMQFDHLIIALQAFFNENTKAPSIRDQFSRLRQIATILQLTKLEEVNNYVNDPDLIQNQQLTTNTLTNDEIKKFLSLRKEFDIKRIQNLRL